MTAKHISSGRTAIESPYTKTACKRLLEIGLRKEKLAEGTLQAHYISLTMGGGGVS